MLVWYPKLDKTGFGDRKERRAVAETVYAAIVCVAIFEDGFVDVFRAVDGWLVESLFRFIV